MKNLVIVHSDGASRGNPGSAAIAVIIWDENKTAILEEYSKSIGETTNNVAEYKSLIIALEIAGKHTSKEVHIFMDSKLVINQMNSNYKVKKAHLRELHQKANDLAKSFEKVIYTHVPRTNKYQKQVDKIVNLELDKQKCCRQ